ncbi:MAG TPA: TonB-dependent receptor [Ohtaekwangia sp.]|nr:TonB-dependent receptor [Ohtaekwangia sp.]
MKKILLVMISCWLLVATAQAQQRTVTGKVTDAADGSAVPGVSVVIKGTTNGTVTDADGNYSLGASDADILAFSFIGFETLEIPVGQQTVVNASMVASIEQLGEVVVIGYGEREKKDLTGAISTVNAEDLSKSHAINPELAMQGKMAGVFVSTPGGNPNARPQVRIRGVGTFNNAEPLYVVDGVPLFEFGESVTSGVVGDLRGDVNVFSLINPNDIESISVLKDASSAAIYGVRAANGVILITTKKGKMGRPRVELNASRGIQNIAQKFDVLNTAEFAALQQEMLQNDLLYRRDHAPSADPGALPLWDTNAQFNVFNPAHPDYLGNSPTYNWQKELLNENAVVEDYSARVSGGSESTTYYLSGGYSRTESVLIGNQLERFSLATNLQSNISKVFSTGFTYRLAYADALDNTVGDLGGASTISPWQPIYDPNDPTGFAPTQATPVFTPNPAFNLDLKTPGVKFNRTPIERLWGPESSSNYFANMAMRENDYQLIKNLGSAFLQVEPIAGLRFKGTVSADWTQNRRNNFQIYENYRFEETERNPYAGHDGNALAHYTERASTTFNLNKEFSINFNKAFGNHSIDVLLNASEQKIKYEIFSNGAPIDYIEKQFRSIPERQEWNNGFETNAEYALQGYLARGSYNYNDKYYLDVTIRRDGSSNFAPDYRWGTFPSVSAAWRISSESFFSGALTFIDDLKIRGGYGELGNQNLGGVGFPAFMYLSTLSTTPDYALGSGNGNALGSIMYGAYFPKFPIVDLSWEIAKTTSVGFDAVAFGSKLSFSFDYYRRNTEGILQAVQLPGSSGIAESPTFNIGSVTNSGIELQVNYAQIMGDLRVDIGGNLTTTRNRVTALYRDQPLSGGETRTQEGYPIGYIFGYKTGGILQSDDEAADYNAAIDDMSGANRQPGDMWFQDVKTNPLEGGQLPLDGPDGFVNGNDRTYLGKTIPGFYYGINLSAQYKGFDLSLLFQGVGDVQRINYARWGGETMSGSGLNYWTSVRDRWTPENPSSSMPRAIYGDPAQNNRFSDRWVEDAGFMRLKNFQLGYTVPSSVLGKTGFVDRIRVYISGSNVFTLTKWEGIDPENDGIPPARVFSLGISAGF